MPELNLVRKARELHGEFKHLNLTDEFRNLCCHQFCYHYGCHFNQSWKKLYFFKAIFLRIQIFFKILKIL